MRAFERRPTALDGARTDAEALDGPQLRTDPMPETLVGWTPELAAKRMAAIRPGELDGEPR
jgi:hypothetical protein